MAKKMRLLLCLLAFLGNSLFVHAQEEVPLVVSSASIFADMAATIGGNLVEVKTIVPIGGDPHVHEPTPGDAQLVNKADLVLRNGLTFEGWLNELIENAGSDAEVVTITEGITPLASSEYANSNDPHCWMDAKWGQVYLKNIRDALVRLRPEHEEEFNFNYELYSGQLADLDQWIKDEISSIPEQRRVLITSHDAFRYYANRYGLQVESVLGTSTDADVQTSDIVRLNKVIKSTGVPAVFIETTVNPKLLKQLAEDNDIRVGGSLYSDSLGDKDSPASTYLDMLRYNTEIIVKALTAAPATTAEDAKDDKSSGPAMLIGVGVLGLLIAGILLFTLLRRAR